MFLGGNRGNLCVEELRWDSTPPVREKRRLDTRNKKRETTRAIAESMTNATRLASSSTAWFPGRNECSGAHCNLIEQESEDSFCPRVWGKRKDGTEDRARTR